MNQTAAKIRKFSFKWLWPLVLLGAAVGVFFALGLDRYLAFEALRENRELLVAFVAQRGALAVFVYIAIYFTMMALPLPWASVLTLAGGFLFGAFLGTFYAVVGATIGATIIFVVAKTSLGDQLRARAGGALKKLEKGFRENAFRYLLVLRLIPFFPFFVINLAPAFLGVSTRTFVLATFFGIIPGTFVLSLAGSGLGSILESGDGFSVGAVLTPQMIGALVGLAVLALLPVVYTKIKAQKLRTP